MNRTATVALIAYSVGATAMLLVAADIFSPHLPSVDAKSDGSVVMAKQVDPSPVAKNNQAPIPEVSIDRKATTVSVAKHSAPTQVATNLARARVMPSPNREHNAAVSRERVMQVAQYIVPQHATIRQERTGDVSRTSVRVPSQGAFLSSFRERRISASRPFQTSRVMTSNAPAPRSIFRKKAPDKQSPLPPSITYRPSFQLPQTEEYKPTSSGPAADEPKDSGVIVTYTPSGGVIYRPAGMAATSTNRTDVTTSDGDDAPTESSGHRESPRRRWHRHGRC